jgi:hypothetical protein
MSNSMPNAPQYDQKTSQDVYASPDNGTGLWSMILGIVGFLFGGLLLGVPAIILGLNGRKKAAAGKATNGGQATAGLVLGIISTLLSVVGILFIVGLMASGS